MNVPPIIDITRMSTRYTRIVVLIRVIVKPKNTLYSTFVEYRQTKGVLIWVICTKT